MAHTRKKMVKNGDCHEESLLPVFLLHMQVEYALDGVGPIMRTEERLSVCLWILSSFLDFVQIFFEWDIEFWVKIVEEIVAFFVLADPVIYALGVFRMHLVSFCHGLDLVIVYLRIFSRQIGKVDGR